MNQGIEVLSPASYIQNSGWLFQETKGTKWTTEENKQFENALAVFDKDTPDRWLKVAAMIPGKTVGDVIKQYRELEEDVSDIEAGLIPITRHVSSCFTLELIEDDRGYDGFKQLLSGCGKRGISTRSSEQERKKGVPWTEDEHRLFLMGLKKYGKGDWRSISRHFVTSRTPTQVASHAQKYFLRQHNGGKDKRRSSIHDITIVHIPDDYLPSPEKAGPISPDNSSTFTKLPSQSVANEQQREEIPGSGDRLRGWNPLVVAMACDRSNGNNPVKANPDWLSCHVPKLEGQHVFTGSFPGTHFDPYGHILSLQSLHHH
ncbi:hypothetical protein MLD38_029949 [Melastoma candidum]|uniref:Uncharacterized protein n=1 Tax=Melastoma candidum TaxID=119954 RepID=A0ACB9MK29_9MYRT|nr:hypothetical protein MLD38_029949 [Melastoma candidum]